MLTPFEIDCERKRGALMEFRDQRSRRLTCRCGVRKPWHADEVSAGRCPRFRAMSIKEWAEWVGVEYKEALR